MGKNGMGKPQVRHHANRRGGRSLRKMGKMFRERPALGKGKMLQAKGGI